MDHPAFELPHRAARAAAAGAAAVRAARRLAACAMLAGMAAALLPAGARAQDAGGPIVIPGNAEKNPAALAELAGHLQAAAPGRSSAAVLSAAAQSMAPARGSDQPVDRFAKAANADGSIVIAGPGETAAPAMIHTSFRPDANGIVTIPAVGQAAGGGLTRVNVSTASRQVVPVVVTGATPPAVGRQAAAMRPVTADPAAGDGFDTLSSRGEPPEFDAKGRLVAVAAASTNTMAAAPTAATSTNTIPAAARTAATSTNTMPTAAPVAANPAPTARTQTVRLAASAVQTASAFPAAPAGQQDAEAIRRTALAYLQQQSAGLPGKVDITVAQVFPRGLAACTTLEPFMPTGTRLWGRMTVGVRCAGEKPWTLYLQARISIHATYYLATRAIAAGDTLTAADLAPRDGDLTGLPQAVITDPAQAVGSVSLVRVAAGFPLRSDMLKSASAVTIGQTVRVVAQGQGFAISAEGSALNNASPGQQVRVKTSGGQIISGVVKDGSTVEIQL